MIKKIILKRRNEYYGKDFIAPFNDDKIDMRIICLVDGKQKVEFKVSRYHIEVNSPYLMKKYKTEKILNIQSSSINTFVHLLALIHEKNLEQNLNDEKHKALMDMIKQYQAYGALFSFVKTLKRQIEFPTIEISLSTAYSYAIIINDWRASSDPEAQILLPQKALPSREVTADLNHIIPTVSLDQSALPSNRKKKFS